MDWTCSVCKQPNIGDDHQCINCGCSSVATEQQVALGRANYGGEIFSEEVQNPSAFPRQSETSAEDWWNTKVDRLDGAFLIFGVYFVVGFLLSLIGAFRSSGSHTLLTVFGGGMLMGICFVIRFLLSAANVSDTTRKRLVFEHSLLCVVACMLIVFRFG